MLSLQVHGYDDSYNFWRMNETAVLPLEVATVKCSSSSQTRVQECLPMYGV